MILCLKYRTETRCVTDAILAWTQSATRCPPEYTTTEAFASLAVEWLNGMSLAEFDTELYQIFASYSPGLFSVGRASVALENGGDTLRLVALDGDNAMPLDMPIPIGTTSTGQAFLNRQIRIARNLDDIEYPDLIDLQRLKLCEVRSQVADISVA